MKLRHLTAWFFGVALLGSGAMLLCAQPPQPPRETPVRIGREKLRAEIIKLRTETEMLRFDYELARDGLLDEVKVARGLKMAGAMLGSLTVTQTGSIQSGAKPVGAAPSEESEPNRKQAAEAAKAAEQEEKKAAAEETASIAEAKKELSRRFTLLTQKRLDLEDAERNYREISR